MTTDYGISGGDREAQHALWSLHQTAGSVSAIPPTAALVTFGDALAKVAAAEHRDIPTSAKLDLLGALARSDLPGFDDHSDAYHAIATAIGTDHGLDSTQIIADVKQAAAGVPFGETQTGQTLPHHVTAFFMEDVCNTATVVVDDRSATWVFSEFETDAPYDEVAGWIDPRSWPERGPMMFKGMTPIGELTEVPGSKTTTEWHGTFLETVQLVELLETELHCDYYKQGDLFAGMTYSLVKSHGDQINVDRGFLLVNELGGSRHVKALKIVGFTNDIWDDVALWVCPIWTDFVRGAVRGGDSSGPLPPSSGPGRIGGAAEQWSNLAGVSAAAYTKMAAEWARDVTSGHYTPDDLVRDGARFWLQVYRDMANASASAYALLEQLAQEPVDQPAPQTIIPLAAPQVAAVQQSAAVAPLPDAKIKPVPMGDDSEGTTLPVTGLDPNTPLESTHLTRIGVEQTVIPSKAVKVSPTVLTDKMAGIHVEADVRGIGDGLYVGEVKIGTEGLTAPIQLYVSRAVGEESP